MTSLTKAALLADLFSLSQAKGCFCSMIHHDFIHLKWPRTPHVLHLPAQTNSPPGPWNLSQSRGPAWSVSLSPTRPVRALEELESTRRRGFSVAMGFYRSSQRRNSVSFSAQQRHPVFPALVSGANFPLKSLRSSIYIPLFSQSPGENQTRLLKPKHSTGDKSQIDRHRRDPNTP